jgi:hypothetical protein
MSQGYTVRVEWVTRHGEDARHQYTSISNMVGDRRKDVPVEEAFQSGDTVYSFGT